MIVPLALVCTQRMVTIQNILESHKSVWYSNYSWRPAKLFDAVNRALSIFTAIHTNIHEVYSTEYTKWAADDRKLLFRNKHFVKVSRKRDSFWIPKFTHKVEKNILEKVLKSHMSLGNYLSNHKSSSMYYRTTGGLYWKVFTDFSPKFYSNGIVMKSSRETSMSLGEELSSKTAVAIFSSNLFWWWYTITSNLRDLNPSDIKGFRFSSEIATDNAIKEKGEEYLKDLENNSTMLIREQKNKGTTETQSFKISKSKPIIDEIDKLLAKHYGFTEEELDFIINYDIKYRMGDELNKDEE